MEPNKEQIISLNSYCTAIYRASELQFESKNNSLLTVLLFCLSKKYIQRRVNNIVIYTMCDVIKTSAWTKNMIQVWHLKASVIHNLPSWATSLTWLNAIDTKDISDGSRDEQSSLLILSVRMSETAPHFKKKGQCKEVERCLTAS